MAMQQALTERRQPILRPYQVIETIGGFDGARIVTATNGNSRAVVMDAMMVHHSNTVTGVSLGCTYFAGAGDYDPVFVESVRLADAAAPEASFNNVVDMLDWLNRE
jgi:hypothetical protein